MWMANGLRARVVVGAAHARTGTLYLPHAPPLPRASSHARGGDGEQHTLLPPRRCYTYHMPLRRTRRRILAVFCGVQAAGYFWRVWRNTVFARRHIAAASSLIPAPTAPPCAAATPCPPAFSPRCHFWRRTAYPSRHMPLRLPPTPPPPSNCPVTCHVGAGLFCWRCARACALVGTVLVFMGGR